MSGSVGMPRNVVGMFISDDAQVVGVTGQVEKA